MVWKIEKYPERRMWNDDLGLHLEVDPLRFGNTFKIKRGNESFIDFFGYPNILTNEQTGEKIPDKNGKFTVIWNVSSDSGLPDKGERRKIIEDVLNVYQLIWGSGLGVGPNQAGLNVNVAFDAVVPG